jgi:putative spermidine/putrescine transport system permease protein
MLIERYVNALRNWEQASAMSVILLVLMLLLVLLAQYSPSQDETTRQGAAIPRGARHLFRLLMLIAEGRERLLVLFSGRTRNLPVMRTAAEIRVWSKPSSDDHPGWVVRVIGGGGLVFLTLPLVIIFLLAFSDAPFLKFPPTGFSLRWFENFFARPEWLSALFTSVKVASLTMLVATLIGAMAAIALVRVEFRGKGLMIGFLLSPIVVPTVILAIALYYLFARLGLVGTVPGLVMGHIVLAIPYVIILVAGALRSVDNSLELAAFPAIRPAVLGSALFAFLASFDELVIALFIAGTDSKTLPKRIWEGVREEIDPTTAAVAAMLISLSLLLLLVSEAARNRAKQVRV